MPIASMRMLIFQFFYRSQEFSHEVFFAITFRYIIHTDNGTLVLPWEFLMP